MILKYKGDMLVRCKVCKKYIKVSHTQHLTNHLSTKSHLSKYKNVIATRKRNIFNIIFKSKADWSRARWYMKTNTPVSKLCKNWSFFRVCKEFWPYSFRSKDTHQHEYWSLSGYFRSTQATVARRILPHHQIFLQTQAFPHW